MTHQLRMKLPAAIVDHIKLYTGEGIWRRGKYINIHRIPRNDYRYEVLKRLPRIKQVVNDDDQHKRRGCVWFKLPSTSKFMVITVRYTARIRGQIPHNGYIWEMRYSDSEVLHRIF